MTYPHPRSSSPSTVPPFVLHFPFPQDRASVIVFRCIINTACDPPPTHGGCAPLCAALCKALTLYTQRVADPVTLAKGAASSLTTRVIPGGQWPAGVSAEMLAVATEGATHEAGQLPLSV